MILDIETSPNIGHIWGLWNQNIGLSQLMESGEVLCFAAKWLGEKKIYFASVENDGKNNMLSLAHGLVSEADVVVHFNGKSFDMPWLNAEWARVGMSPPAPYREIDLCLIAKKTFRYPSNKLEYLATELLGEGKVKHAGHSLWVRVMAGDPKAWAEMAKYNKADVVLTEKLYNRLRPWVKHLPHPGLYDGKGAESCPDCGGQDLERRGYAYTALSKFQQFRCRDCGRWSRSGRRVAGVDTR